MASVPGHPPPMFQEMTSSHYLIVYMVTDVMSCTHMRIDASQVYWCDDGASAKRCNTQAQAVFLCVYFWGSFFIKKVPHYGEATMVSCGENTSSVCHKVGSGQHFLMFAVEVLQWTTRGNIHSKPT